MFLIWLLAMPMVGAVGFVTYRQHPKPFHTVMTWTNKGVKAATKAYNGYQAKHAADAAAAAAAEKKKKKHSF